MLNMLGSPTPRSTVANNSANKEDETVHQHKTCGSERKSLRNKKTATIDFSNDTETRFARSTPPQSSQDDTSLNLTTTPPRKLSRNMATSRTVRVKPTFKSGESGGNRFARPLVSLSHGQKQAVLSTWRHMKEHYGERATEQILHKLINDQPKIKDLFYQAAFLTAFTRSSNSIATFRDHARLLHRAFDDLIENLDNRSGCDRVLKELRENGTKHAFLRKSGFKADTWERFGEAAVDVINGYECVKASPEASKGWCILIASITDELRSGFETEARKQSYCVDRPKSACD